MSDNLYSTILRFHNGIGLAKLRGDYESISIPPDLGSGPVHRLEYRPEIGERQVSMTNAEPMRRMTDEEVYAADRWLEKVISTNDSCRYDEPWKEGRC